MNKIIIIVIVTTLAILQASCLTSLQPLITAGNAIKENRVTGTWQYNNNVFHVEEMTKSKLFSEIKKSIVAKGGEFQPITGKDREDSIYYSKAYMISFKKKGADHYYAAGFTHIGNDLFMDLFPVLLEDSTNQNTSYSPFSIDYAPTFTIAKVEILNNNSMVLKFLNGDFIKQQIAKGNMRIRHQEDKLFESFLVTASTYELTQFLQKYSHDERLFSQENSVTLTRKG
jgi:hypothetical protein